MLPGILAHMLFRLQRMPSRSPDEEELYHALLYVGMKLRPQIIESRTASINEAFVSFRAQAGLPTGEALINDLARAYTFIDDNPIGLGADVTGCPNGSDCPLNRP
jgi:hypothetical protein